MKVICIKVSEKNTDISRKYQNEYAIISLDVTKQVEKLIENSLDEIFVTPPTIILHNYYLKRPSTPWIENPLAFFINGLYDDGFDNAKMEKQYRELDDEYGVFEDYDFKKYINNRFKREYVRSFRLIKENINSIRGSEKKQKYITELCEHVTKLFYKSCSQKILKERPDPFFLRPYKSLVRNLIKEFPKFAFKIDFNFEQEHEDLIIESASFLKNLHKAKFLNKYYEEIDLFQTGIKRAELSSFISGDLYSIPAIYFQWPIESVYYLIMKLIDNGASFSPTELDKSNKIYFAKEQETTPFKRGNYYTFKSKFEAGEKHPELEQYFKLIDDLFR